MKRRRFVKSLVAAPAASALLAQQPPPPPGKTANPAPGVPQNPAQGTQPPGFVAQELPRLEVSIPDEAAASVPRFFEQAQFDALRHLCEILMPPVDNRPGAAEAHAAEFLDFLIGDSPADRQQVYHAGLEALNAESSRRYGKPFAATSAGEADALLAPLRAPWQYHPPADPLARFLIEAKADARTATVNSREYIAVAGAGSRRRGGVGLYWHSLD